jgi:hypothetical protein
MRFSAWGYKGVPFGGGGTYPIVPFLLPLLSFLLYCLYNALYSESQRNSVSTFGQALGSEDHSLSFASLKNQERDELPIENLPWGSGKGICLWRQSKTAIGFKAFRHLPAKQERSFVRMRSPCPSRHGEMSRSHYRGTGKFFQYPYYFVRRPERVKATSTMS